jgi:regulator of sigma E protease
MSAIYFILLLGGLIFIHELGHFLVAKACGVRVLTFSIGFGPALLKKQWGDTEYRLAAIPLGGYVRMHGDEPGQEVPAHERNVAFNYKPLWQRALIVLAGPVSNLILPFVVFFFMHLTYSELSPAYVGEVINGGPAWQAGIRPGDVIVKIDGDEIRYWWEMQDRINDSIGEELEVEVLRGGEVRKVKVTPEEYLEVILPRVNLVERLGRIQVTQIFIEPVVGVDPNGRAYAAGLRNWDRVLRVDGTPIRAYAELERSLAEATGPVTLDVVREDPYGTVGHALFNLLSPPLSVTVPPGGDDLGLWSAEMVVHKVDEGTPAAELGLQPGDHVLTMDGATFTFWGALEGTLADAVEGSHELTWFDGETVRKGTFSLVPTTEKGEFNEDLQVVIFGAHNHSRYGAPDPLPNDSRITFAARETWSATIGAYRLTFYSVAGLLVGKVPVSDMGGPILIYDMASKTEKHGWDFFFRLMALLSISLGVINLFPIPILDGGHLLFFSIEAIIRREVPIKIRQWAAYVGLFLILTLMVVVFRNDIARNWDTISTWFN